MSRSRSGPVRLPRVAPAQDAGGRARPRSRPSTATCRRASSRAVRGSSRSDVPTSTRPARAARSVGHDSIGHSRTRVRRCRDPTRAGGSLRRAKPSASSSGERFARATSDCPVRRRPGPRPSASVARNAPSPPSSARKGRSRETAGSRRGADVRDELPESSFGMSPLTRSTFPMCPRNRSRVVLRDQASSSS